MYCAKCSSEIKNGSMFCPKCGEKVLNEALPIGEKAVIDTQGCIDRNALISHLYDIRALELTKEKLSRKINENNQTMSRLGIPCYFKKPPSRIFLYCIVGGYIGGIILSLLSLFAFDYFNIEVSKLKIDNRSIMILLVMFAGFLIGAMIGFVISLIHSKKEKKKYNKNIQADNQRVQYENEQKQQISIQNKQHINDVNHLCKILNDAYSLNIIPGPFRNVAGACYLYDFLSTSQESLQSAMINYNINNLSVQMQTMIDKQSDMILEQYITNARLTGIQSQNADMMRQLQNIEHNSAVAAQYAGMIQANTNSIKFYESFQFWDKYL